MSQIEVHRKRDKIWRWIEREVTRLTDSCSKRKLWSIHRGITHQLHWLTFDWILRRRSVSLSYMMMPLGDLRVGFVLLVMIGQVTGNRSKNWWRSFSLRVREWVRFWFSANAEGEIAESHSVRYFPLAVDLRKRRMTRVYLDDDTSVERFSSLHVHGTEMEYCQGFCSV
jgi:hypothetical protein